MKKLVKRLVLIIAFLLVFGTGIYVGGVLCVYHYAYPMVAKSISEKSYGYGTSKYFSNYQEDMNNTRLRMQVSISWPGLALEEDLDLKTN